MKKPEQLSGHALQLLARQYSEVEQTIKDQQKLREEIREELLLQVEHYGSAAPKSDKTFRLESENYFIDVTQSESLSVNDDAVKKLKGELPSAHFKKLFSVKTYFAKARDAEKAIAQEPAAVRTAFTKCFTVKPASPKLSVKEKKES